MSEELIVKHCAPTLAGMKTGNIFPCACGSKDDLILKVRSINKAISKKGVCAIPLRCSNNTALIYLYRPGKLKSDLACPVANGLLSSLGYPCNCPQKCIARLKDKLQKCSDFPHEIGLFLSYPPKDVLGFMECKGSNCKCCGIWKVYDDEHHALKLFAKYKKCSRIYNKKWQSGTPFEKLVVAG